MKRLLTKAEFIRNYNRIFPLVISFAEQKELTIQQAAYQLERKHHEKVNRLRIAKYKATWFTLGQALLWDILRSIERFTTDIGRAWNSFKTRQRKALANYRDVASASPEELQLRDALTVRYPVVKPGLKLVSPSPLALAQLKQALPASLQLVNDKIRDLGQTCYGTKEAISPASDIGNDLVAAYWLPEGQFVYIFFSERLTDFGTIALLRALILGELERVFALNYFLRYTELEMCIEEGPCGELKIMTEVSTRRARTKAKK